MKKLDRARHRERLPLPEDAWRPTYHVTPPVGWMNDPNGFCFHDGKAQLFFQYNPLAATWGPMHWGHCTSSDFVTWERLPVALAPDTWYDGLMGCFSGTALSEGAKPKKGGGLVLMYTGVSLFGRQQQCIARSEDGIDFKKDTANPVIPTRKLPRHAWKGAFRDPELFVRDGIYYCLVGTQDKRTKKGILLLYRSEDLHSWEYVNEAYACPASDMIECPDLVEVDGRELLLFSPTNHPPREDGFRNMHASVYSIGRLDIVSGVFSGQDYHELDGGFDFYAPQTLRAPDGRTIMIAWMQMWKRSMPTEVLGWAGAMTLPRELSIRGDALIQKPVREIERCRAKAVIHRNLELTGLLRLDGVTGTRIELIVKVALDAAASFELRLFVGPEHRTVLRYEREAGRFSLDRSKSGVPIRELYAGGVPSEHRSRTYQAPDGKLHLRVFLDRSSVEVFLGDGELTMTGVVYPDAGEDGVEFASEGKMTIVSVEKWDIAVQAPSFAGALIL